MLRNLGLALALLGGCKEAGDDFTSQVECNSYCAKTFDCEGTNPTTNETNECVADCRDTIEDECGNENQAAVNDKINECVDLGCDDFYACMVFEAAPECMAFVP